MNEYEAKKQERIERYRELADKHRDKSDQRHKAFRQTADMIPLGQPILVGHHSEARHRRDIARMDNNLRAASEHQKTADYYEQKAASAESNNAISSDDPEAVVKLKEKIAEMEALQTKMRAANKLVRKKDKAGLVTMGFSESQADKLFEPDFCGRLGFPDYALTNNSGNIRRCKERLAHLERHSKDETTEREVNGVRIVDNVEENRLQLFFAAIPAEEIRKQLKSAGFRWSPTNKAWQRHRGNSAVWQAENILAKLAS